MPSSNDGPDPEPGAGLYGAWRRCQEAADPPELELLRGNNARALRQLAKLIHVLCDGRRGTKFFMGSLSAAKLLACTQPSILNRLRQLQDRGIIRRVWTGGLCVRDEDGNEYAAGKLVRRASEFVYLGLPRLRSA